MDINKKFSNLRHLRAKSVIQSNQMLQSIIGLTVINKNTNNLEPIASSTLIGKMFASVIQSKTGSESVVLFLLYLSNWWQKLFIDLDWSLIYIASDSLRFSDVLRHEITSFAQMNNWLMKWAIHWWHWMPYFLPTHCQLSVDHPIRSASSDLLNDSFRPQPEWPEDIEGCEMAKI